MNRITDKNTIISIQNEAPHPETLLHSNYIYAAVNSVAYKPLYLKEHLAKAAESYENLYGYSVKYNIDDIHKQIYSLLDDNSMSRLGNIINIYFIPSTNTKDKKTEILISWHKSTIYRGYELISLRSKAILTNYEIPFEGHRTAVSLTTANYMQNFAERSGKHVALHINRAGKLMSCGEYPVFVVKDGKVSTPSTPENVERLLMQRACRIIGITVEEREIDSSEINDADEIMVFNHTGILSILSLGNTYFYNITALRLEKVLPQITEEGLKK